MMQAGIAPALPRRGNSHALGDSCNPWPPTEADLKLSVKYKKKARAPQPAFTDTEIDPYDSRQQSSSSSNNRRGSPSSCLPAGGALRTSEIFSVHSSLHPDAPQVGGGAQHPYWRPMHPRLPQNMHPPCSRSSGSAAKARTLRY